MEGETGSEIDAGSIRFLKGLVTVLTVTMIAGVLTVVTLLVMRLGAADRIALPDSIVLPDGGKPVAFTQGSSWYAVVTQEDEVFVYSRATGELLQRIVIEVE